MKTHAMEVYTFDVEPMAKPRMTRGDRANYRPIVQRYWDFKKAMLVFAGQQKFTLGSAVALAFYCKMPESWSERKKGKMEGKPVQKRPDIDNYIKAVLDALAIEDGYVYEVHAVKYYSKRPRIEIVNL